MKQRQHSTFAKKEAVPFALTKKLSSLQMMHVTGFHIPFIFTPSLYRATHYNLWTPEEILCSGGDAADGLLHTREMKDLV